MSLCISPLGGALSCESGYAFGISQMQAMLYQRPRPASEPIVALRMNNDLSDEAGEMGPT